MQPRLILHEQNELLYTLFYIDHFPVPFEATHRPGPLVISFK
jgi:hypothetical protein